MHYHVFRLIDGCHTHETLSRCLGQGLRELRIIERAHGLAEGDLICFRTSGKDEWRILTNIADDVRWKAPLAGDIFLSDVGELRWDAAYLTKLNKSVDAAERELGVR